MALSSFDINVAFANASRLIFVDEISRGERCMFSPSVPIQESGKFATVVKFKLQNGKTLALRVWSQEGKIVDQITEYSKEISKELRKLNSPYFVNYSFHDNAILIQNKKRPLLAMEWCNGTPLKAYIENHLQDKAVIGKLADDFLIMFKFLHNHKISHGDLQHKNIKIREDGQIVLLDYDSLYFPTKFFENRREVLYGYEDYQHPNRSKNKFSNEKIDYFSELIIYLSIISLYYDSTLWKDFDIANGENRFLFSTLDYKDLKKSKVYGRLISLPLVVKDLLKILEIYLNTKDVCDLFPFFQKMKLSYLTYKEPTEYCINCGKKVEENDEYCYYCGTKVYKSL